MFLKFMLLLYTMYFLCSFRVQILTYLLTYLPTYLFTLSFSTKIAQQAWMGA